MAEQVEQRPGGNGWRIAGWSIAALLLLLPAVAGAPWTASDFVFAAVIIGGVGLMFELGARMSRNIYYRGGIGAALAATFFTIWSSAAVGIIGEGEQDVMFLGVILIALLGSILVRFRAEGMARVMAVAAGAHFLACIVGAFTDVRGGMISATFTAFWLGSAFLFARAARDAAPVTANA